MLKKIILKQSSVSLLDSCEICPVLSSKRVFFQSESSSQNRITLSKTMLKDTIKIKDFYDFFHYDSIKNVHYLCGIGQKYYELYKSSVVNDIGSIVTFLWIGGIFRTCEKFAASSQKCKLHKKMLVIFKIFIYVYFICKKVKK